MIYFVQGAITRLIKIGKAVDCEHRLKALQCGSPDKLHIIKQIYVDNDVEAEYLIHSRFHFCRQHGEWFSENEKLVKFLNSLDLQNRVFDLASRLDKMGIKPSADYIKREATRVDGLRNGRSASRTRAALHCNPVKNYTEKGRNWRQEKQLAGEIASFRYSLEARGVKTK